MPMFEPHPLQYLINPSAPVIIPLTHITTPYPSYMKVLWMCGAHTTAVPEGISRVIRTKGEVEPCKLEVKVSIGGVHRFVLITFVS